MKPKARLAWWIAPRGRIAFTDRLRRRRPSGSQALRRQRWTGKQIAQETCVSPATVSRVLKRLGLSRVKDLEPATPVIRYERQLPGDMIHIDIKKLGRFDRVGHRITGDRTGQSNSRGIGWEFVHVAIDDASRIAFSLVMPNEKKESATAFLKAALVYYQSLGVTVARVMTDNGSCFTAKDTKSLLIDIGMEPCTTPVRSPQSNGMAEAFVKTFKRVYVYPIPDAETVIAQLPLWFEHYNTLHPHKALGYRSPREFLNRQTEV